MVVGRNLGTIGLVCDALPCGYVLIPCIDRISFKQSMSLFNNGGNNALDFVASYVEDFVRVKSQQRGSETNDGVYFSVSLDEDVSLFSSDLDLVYDTLIHSRFTENGQSSGFPSSSAWILISRSHSVWNFESHFELSPTNMILAFEASAGQRRDNVVSAFGYLRNN